MSNFFNSLITAIGIVFLIPTFLILVSWNALPGDNLYGLKRGLESIVFVLTKDTPLATAFSLKFTDRRFDEANILLSKNGSTVGYTLLVAEAQKTKDVIIAKKDAQGADELVTKIDQYEKTVDEKKLALAVIPVTQTPSPLPLPTQKSVLQPPVVLTPTPLSLPVLTPHGRANAKTIEDLDKTKKDLEKIKGEIKKELPDESNRDKDKKNDH